VTPRSIIISSTLAFLLWYNGLFGDLVVISTPPPFAADRLCVLVVEETEDSTKMTMAELAARNTLRELIEQKNGEYRQLDDESDLSNYKKWVQDAMAVPREGLPWAVGSDGKRGFSKPAPKTDTEATKLLEGF